MYLIETPKECLIDFAASDDVNSVSVMILGSAVGRKYLPLPEKLNHPKTRGLDDLHEHFRLDNSPSRLHSATIKVQFVGWASICPRHRHHSINRTQVDISVVSKVTQEKVRFKF